MSSVINLRRKIKWEEGSQRMTESFMKNIRKGLFDNNS